MPACQDMPWPKHLLVVSMFFSSALTACQVPCHSLQVSQELQMLSSLNLCSIVNLSRIMASLGILFGACSLSIFMGEAAFYSGNWKYRPDAVVAGGLAIRCFASFLFSWKRDFSILEISIRIYWVISEYNWLLLVKLRPLAALIRKAP